jgi:serine/threonine protein kinase
MKEEEIIASLSHSYFNHILKDVQPFLEYFDTSLIKSQFKKSQSQKNNVYYQSELIERLFFMACLNSVDISLPFNYNTEIYSTDNKAKKSDWLLDIKPFGSKSKQGVVSKSLIFDNMYVVVKKAKTSKFDEITIRDFCVGVNLNKILNEAPFFVHTIGCFQFKNQFHIVTQFIDGINLKSFLQNKKSTFVEFLNIFFQILLGLEIAQNKLNFAHYDLHTDNVILVPCKETIEVTLYGYNYIIKNNYRPVMIDFGLSSVHTKGQTLGQKSLETKGIYNHLSPGYDIYVFLLFCIDIAQSHNLSIFKGITDLLLFFKIQTNLSVDCLTSNHIRCLRKGISNLIPYQFINFLIQNYSNYLEVEIEFKKCNDKCLVKEPLFLTLKQILDTNNELEISRRSTEPKNIQYKKGFIRSLVDNIKIYYWYKDKINLTQNQIQRLIDVDKYNLQNLIDDLNLQVYKKGNEVPSVTIEQKNLFFIALDFYHLILELELQHQYPYYKEWMINFRDTFVYKNIFKQLDTILREERSKRCIKIK